MLVAEEVAELGKAEDNMSLAECMEEEEKVFAPVETDEKSSTRTVYDSAHDFAHNSSEAVDTQVASEDSSTGVAVLNQYSDNATFFQKGNYEQEDDEEHSRARQMPQSQYRYFRSGGESTDKSAVRTL